MIFGNACSNPAKRTVEKIKSQLKNGDIIFQTSLSNQSKAIQLATGSEFSHMGIVVFQEERPFVFEAVGPVTLTPLAKWIDRGKDDYFVVKRLKNDEVLSAQAMNRMLELGKTYYSKPYDLHFAWSDEKMYCSELVWKLYYYGTGLEIGSLQKLSEFNLEDAVVKEKLRERYGSNIPFNEPVISPVSMFQSELLEEVMQGSIDNEE